MDFTFYSLPCPTFSLLQREDLINRLFQFCDVPSRLLSCLRCAFFFGVATTCGDPGVGSSFLLRLKHKRSLGWDPLAASGHRLKDKRLRPRSVKAPPLLQVRHVRNVRPWVVVFAAVVFEARVPRSEAEVVVGGALHAAHEAHVLLLCVPQRGLRARFAESVDKQGRDGGEENDAHPQEVGRVKSDALQPVWALWVRSGEYALDVASARKMVKQEPESGESGLEASGFSIVSCGEVFFEVHYTERSVRNRGCHKEIKHEH
mmetsp:Transcript_1238/g.2395  ORF Transcript_1238/g.2395 Transcript_1238/m.2395 type:complete len:260 (-) Transcript_1238:3618-4397(-)